MSQAPGTFSPAIRKRILQALNEFIIPALQQQRVLQILAEPPFDFSQVSQRIVQKKFLPDKEQDPLQVLQCWKKEHMLTLRFPSYSFVYEGINYERIGITAALAQEVKQVAINLAGITEIELPAPGIICYPNHIARSDGSPRSQVWPHAAKYLKIKLMDETVLVSLGERAPGKDISSHGLEIHDVTLVQMGLIYMEEIRQPDNPQGSQAQLLAFMCRLRRYLLNNKLQISNSCWPDLGDVKVSRTRNQMKCQQLSNEIIDYLQTHLHSELSLETIATHFGYTPFHLNRIFRQAQGTTVMRYVTALRINIAKEILRKTSERVGDVATLVGFTTPASFCNVFRKHTGLTPNEFRRQNSVKPKNVGMRK